MIIAIDGPAGVGKSTIAKALAQKLNFSYFDTGAMYRAATYAFIKNSIDYENETKVVDFLNNNFNYYFKEENGNRNYFVNDEDVTEIIRSTYVTDLVSKIATKEYIRKILVPLQRQYAENRDVVTEGRDIGSVVFPNADVKIYLTAKASVRAERRFQDYLDKYPQDFASFDKQQILLDIQKRDEMDSTRKFSPLKKTPDAFLIDTSNLDVNGVVNKIVKIVKKKTKIKFSYRFVKKFFLFFLKFFYKLEIFGKENIIEGKSIIISNHVSFLDPIILTQVFDEELNFIAKKSIFKKFFLGKIIKILNAHEISLNSPNIKTFRIIDSILKANKKIILFPEGQRSEDGQILKFLPGIGFLVNLTKALVIPVYIKGPLEIWSKKRKLPKMFGKIKCFIGKPVYFTEFEGIDKEKKVEYINAFLEKNLKDLQKKHY
ncbi:MAG: cytidylate kinase [Chlamydiae bacterium RIFCSPHIGHO2_12_FULL_27_8]|nr:MAG: cytidylate kinase [Chlamydiae bacterium RIFCSPHIGHO2_12_FULL_27_8]